MLSPNNRSVPPVIARFSRCCLVYSTVLAMSGQPTMGGLSLPWPTPPVSGDSGGDSSDSDCK